MTRILAISDEVERCLYSEGARELAPDLVVACGDLPFDYLEYVLTILNVPLLYVPGNHDPDLRLPRRGIDVDDFTRPFSFKPWSHELPGPRGCTNVDGRIVEAKGVRVAGLGGSLRYSEGPNQYSQRQMWSRALSLEVRHLKRSLCGRQTVDVLLTHAPPSGVGDADDRAHQGFEAFHRVVAKLAPKVLIHGHVHPYGHVRNGHTIGATRVVNSVGHRLLEI